MKTANLPGKTIYEFSIQEIGEILQRELGKEGRRDLTFHDKNNNPLKAVTVLVALEDK